MDLVLLARLLFIHFKGPEKIKMFNFFLNNAVKDNDDVKKKNQKNSQRYNKNLDGNVSEEEPG